MSRRLTDEISRHKHFCMKRSYAELERIVDSLVEEESSGLDLTSVSSNGTPPEDVDAKQISRRPTMPLPLQLVKNVQVDAATELRVQTLLEKTQSSEASLRKTSLRRLTDAASTLGADALFSQVIPALHTNDDALDSYRLIKIIKRIIPKLPREHVAAWAPQLLAVAQPLLVNDNRLERQQGTELVSALALHVGLKVMVLVVRDDLESTDPGVRIRVAATVAAAVPALGLEAVLPFLEAACSDTRTRPTALIIIQRVAHQMGGAVLPHLEQLVQCTLPGFETPATSRAAALAIAALAKSAAPYGIEAFEPAAPLLWRGVKRAKGKNLAAFMRALGSLVPLMDPDSASEYAPVVVRLAREQFNSPEHDVKRAALIVFQQCMSSMDPQSLRDEIGPEYLTAVYTARNAADPGLSGLIIRTTEKLSETASNTGLIVTHLVDKNVLKDASEPLQGLGVGTIAKVAKEMTLANRTEQLLIDGLLACLHLSVPGILGALKAIAEFVPALGSTYIDDLTAELRAKIANPDPSDRELGANAVAALYERGVYISDVGVWLYEQLGEDSPNVLAAVIKAIAAVVDRQDDLASMRPPISDLLPRLTPILRNRDERVQQACTELIGRIAADGGADIVPAREWMRICFELLELFRAPRLSVRKTANETFGHIATGIGPSDVLLALLSNLRVPDRQSRVNSAVAIGIVAEKCGPFTVVPALLNEFRSPDKNVQHGVLKAFAFMFEFIGPAGTAPPYVNSVTTLLDEALTVRAQVPRQIGASIVKHVALGCIGQGKEANLIHFLNELMPSVFETSPHVIERILEAIDAVRLSLGTAVTMNYLWAGLFHPARKVRTIYWRMYNNAYIDAADAIVPGYPVDEDDFDTWF